MKLTRRFAEMPSSPASLRSSANWSWASRANLSSPRRSAQEGDALRIGSPEQSSPDLPGMSWHVSDETFRRAGETIFQSRRSPPEMSSVYQWPFKQRGSIMWASILNSIYREVLRTSMSGMHKLAAD
jgi:hypothetical protein